MLAPRLTPLAVALFAACGGGASSPDGRLVPGTDARSGDSPSDRCDATEQADATNAVTAEATGLHFDGSAPLRLCGQIDGGHVAAGTVDVDRFAIAVDGAGTDALVRLDSTVLAGELGGVNVRITSANGTIGAGQLEVEHGVFAAFLAPGDYTISVEANDATAPTNVIAYAVELTSDDPATRCPTITGAPDYAEAYDGAASTSNDMIDVAGSPVQTFTLTPATTDAPEASGVVVTPGPGYRLTGMSADVNTPPPGGDDYADRDTFSFSTGADTNELDIRLGWSATADLDFFIFPASGVVPPISRGTVRHAGPDEVTTFAVKPSSTYWIWVGAYDGSTPLPAAYDLSICGKTYTAN